MMFGDNTGDDMTTVTARFLTGLGIAAAGTFLKQYNDTGEMEKVMGDNYDDRKLMDQGLYKYIRHPCYGAQRLLSLGFATMFPTWYSAASAATHWGLTEWLARREEKTVEEEFGDDYKEYKAKTSRWIPNFKSFLQRSENQG